MHVEMAMRAGISEDTTEMNSPINDIHDFMKYEHDKRVRADNVTCKEMCHTFKDVNIWKSMIPAVIIPGLYGARAVQDQVAIARFELKSIEENLQTQMQQAAQSKLDLQIIQQVIATNNNEIIKLL